MSSRCLAPLIRRATAIPSASATSRASTATATVPARNRYPGDARRQARPQQWQNRTDQPEHARSRRGHLPRHASRRGAAPSAAPGTASSPWRPSPSAHLHDHIPPLSSPIRGVTIPQDLQLCVSGRRSPGRRGHGWGPGSSDPAGNRLAPAAVRRLEEHRLAELVVAAVAGDQDVSHAAPGRSPR